MRRLPLPKGMMRRSEIAVRRILAVLFVSVCSWVVGLEDVAAAEAPAVFSPTPLNGGQPYFSIALPPGWTMAADGRKATGGAVTRYVPFTFTPANADVPYVFVKIDNCSANELLDRREKAGLAEQRLFLSGGEPGAEYFDSKRRILWRLGENDRSPHIAATFFGKRVVELRFFYQPGQLGNWTPTVEKIVNHARVYQEGQEVAEYTVDAGLFAPTMESAWFRSLMWVIPLLIVTLIAVERLISRQRFRAEMAEIDANIEERKKRSRVPASLVNAADDYQQQVTSARRKRARGSA